MAGGREDFTSPAIKFPGLVYFAPEFVVCGQREFLRYLFLCRTTACSENSICGGLLRLVPSDVCHPRDSLVAFLYSPSPWVPG